MNRSRKPSPARSQGAPASPVRYKARSSRSVGSPAHSTASGRLSTLVDQFRDENRTSFVVSPLIKTLLNDNTDIEEPRRKSWWKNIENSREINEVLENEKPLDANDFLDDLDVEILSLEKENCTFDLPECSDSDSINSIIVPQRKLFAQKERTPTKYGQVIYALDSMSNTNKTRDSITNIADKIEHVGTKNLFIQKFKKPRPVFPSELLSNSPDKTKEIVTEVKTQTRKLFGAQSVTKRKNMFADLVFVSENEDDIPEIQSKIVPQRKLFAQKENTPTKIRQVIDSQDSISKSNKPRDSITTIADKIEHVSQKNTLVQNIKNPGSVFPSESLSSSSDNSKEIATELKTQTRKLFGGQSGNKRKNMFADLVFVSESEDDISEIQPKLFAFNKNHAPIQRKTLASKGTRDHSPSSSITTDIEMDDWNHLPSSTMMDHHIEEMATTPGKRARLNRFSKLSEVKESEVGTTGTNNTLNQTKKSNKSVSSKSKSKMFYYEQMDNSKHAVSIEEDIDTASKKNNTLKNASLILGKQILVNEENFVADDIKNKSHQKTSLEVSHNKTLKNIDHQVETELEQIENEIMEQDEEMNLTYDDNDHDAIEEENEQANLHEDNKVDNVMKDIETPLDNESLHKINKVVEATEDIEDDRELETEQDEEADNENRTREQEQSEILEVDECDENGEDEQENEEEEASQEVIEMDQNEELEENEKVNEGVIEMEENEALEENLEVNEEVIEMKENEELKENLEVNEELIEMEENEEELEENDEVNEEENENEDVVSDGNDENDNQEESQLEEEDGLEQEESQEIQGNQHISETDNGTPNVFHDTTGPMSNKKDTKSPEAILCNKTNDINAGSFTTKSRNTSLRKTLLKNFSIRHSFAKESIRVSDGTNDSSAAGSGWDSHRTTRKTLRQTFGKDFSPRKSLRTLVMEKMDNRKTVIDEANTKLQEVNSTELAMEPQDINIENSETAEVDLEFLRQSRQTTLEMYLQKVAKDNLEQRQKIKEKVLNDLKSKPIERDLLNCKVQKPRKLAIRGTRKLDASNKRSKPFSIDLEDLPLELIEDMKYKPPPRFKPKNASWVTKRLYKFLETKLEPRYDYKARVRAEKLVETIYNFVKDAKRLNVASPRAINELKREMARLDIVQTHFQFYNFFHNYMPLEIKVKVVPDILNNIPLPPNGVFANILI